MKVRLLLPITSLLLAVPLDVAGQTLTISPDLQRGRLRLQWPNRSNEVFQIQMRASLDQDDWEPLVYLSGDAPRLIWQDESETAPMKFSRVVQVTSATFTNVFQRTLDQQRRANGAKGACAVIITTNAVWIGTSGMSDPVSTNAIQPNMRFSFASCTKMLTAPLILKLEEEGKLSLNDPLSKWLPDFPNITNTITLRQLLNHTSGIHDWFNDSSLWPRILTNDLAKFWTPADILAPVKRPNFRPGTSWSYSNVGFILAGMVAEAAVGEPVHIAWRRRFLDPLQLRSLYFEPQEMMTGELAHGFSRYLTPTLQDISGVPRTAIYSSFWTGAAIMGSPLDMARWTRALYRGEVLASSSMKQMTNLVNATPFFLELPRYGLGTMEISSSKGAFLGHAGDGFGYRCLVGHSPRLDATVLFVINTDTGWDLSGFVRMVEGWKALNAKL